MDKTTVATLLDRLASEGVQDVRKNPDSNRRGQFLAGWHDHSEREQVYGRRVLQDLTWHNLGWRLARLHHDPAGIDDDEIRDTFARAEEVWWERHP